MFTSAKIKADLVFTASLVAVFGFSIPTAVSAALLASAGLIAAALNFGDALATKLDPNLVKDITAEIVKLEHSASGLAPLILPILNSLPGKIGEEVRKAVELAEKGPAPEGDKPAGK